MNEVDVKTVTLINIDLD